MMLERLTSFDSGKYLFPALGVSLKNPERQGEGSQRTKETNVKN